MKDFFAKHKIKLIAGAVILAALAAAFYFGGSGPDSKGWSISKTGGADAPSMEEVTVQEPAAPQAPAEKPQEPAESAPAPETAEPQNIPAPAAGEKVEEPAQSPVEESPAVEPEQTEKVPETAPVEAVEEAPAEEQVPEEQVPEEQSAQEPAEPEPQPGPEVGEVPAELKCTISIRCTTILDHMEDVNEGKRELIPADGWILCPIEVTFTEGESVFDVLSCVLRERMMHLEFSQNPVTGAAYIEGIHNLYEFDCGALSGWLYCVNSWFPNYGSSSYKLADGDMIEWQYTCDLGYDIGGGGVTQ